MKRHTILLIFATLFAFSCSSPSPISIKNFGLLNQVLENTTGIQGSFTDGRGRNNYTITAARGFSGVFFESSFDGIIEVNYTWTAPKKLTARALYFLTIDFLTNNYTLNLGQIKFNESYSIDQWSSSTLEGDFKKTLSSAHTYFTSPQNCPNGYQAQGLLSRFKFSSPLQYPTCNLTNVVFNGFNMSNLIGFHLNESQFNSEVKIEFTTDTFPFFITMNITLEAERQFKFSKSANTSHNLTSCNESDAIIPSIIDDFQEEFRDFFYGNHRMLQKKPEPVTQEFVTPLEYQAAPEEFSEEFRKLLDLTRTPLVYDMLFEGNIISANITANSFSFASGDSRGIRFSALQYYANYSLNLPNASVVFGNYITFDGDVETKNIRFKFGDLSYDDKDFKSKFFNNTQSKQIRSFFNQTLSPVWNASHFVNTPISDCEPAKELQAKLNNMTLVKKYTYFCGAGKEVEISFKNAILSNIAFHPNHELFNSVVNITFYASSGQTQGSITTSSNVGIKKSNYHFTNNTLAFPSSVLAECLKENPKLLDLMIFDFALDFRNKYENPVQALKFLA